MQLLKERAEPESLKVLHILNGRTDLSEDNFAKYMSAEKGFIGESIFDQFIEGELIGDWLILNDLLLEHDHTRFQLDSILLSQYHLYNIEVKYYEGDYIVDENRFLTSSGKDIKNPLLQLEKNEAILRQMIQSSVIHNLNIHSFLVFNHPEFTLYQTPKGFRQIIFPTQLKRFANKLNTQPTKMSQKHFKFAEQILSHQFVSDPRRYVPEYDYRSLKKTIICNHCRTSQVTFNKLGSFSFVFCKSCLKKEKVDDAILRNITDLKLLFPEMNITTNLVFDWCGGIIPKNSIKRVLMSNLRLVGNTNQVHYIRRDG